MNLKQKQYLKKIIKEETAKILKESTDDRLIEAIKTIEQELDWIKYEYEYVPNDDSYYDELIEPYKTMFKNALKYRKRNEDRLMKAARKKWE